jgi:AcrR family transcriptional regulator
MLIHHFGGREGLLVAVVQAVEQRQRDLLDTIIPDPAASPGDAMRAWWKHISDESLWPNERLFFEIYGQALQGRPGTTELLDGIVDAWLEPSAAIFTQLGFPDGRAAARLGVAVTRGLLLDLLATGDHDAVDRAMDVHIAALEAAMRELAADHDPVA